MPKFRTLFLLSRVHKNKSMQHHTLGSGTAEFQVTWPPKLREGTYLVKNVRARFEYRKTIAAHEKQVIMQEKAQPCASLWRKTLRPKDKKVDYARSNWQVLPMAKKKTAQHNHLDYA